MLKERAILEMKRECNDRWVKFLLDEWEVMERGLGRAGKFKTCTKCIIMSVNQRLVCQAAKQHLSILEDDL